MAGSDVAINALMNYLYTLLTDGEDEVVQRNAAERFITWCLPGIPLDKSELRFLVRGIVGEGTTSEEKAQDTAMLIGQASRFARLVDFVPDANGIFSEDQQIAAFQRGANSLSRTYERVLKQSQVAATELTDSEKERLERFRNLLYPEQEVEDILTGKVEKKRVESPILLAYKAFAAKYEQALLEYNSARIAALAAVSAEAVLHFSLNESVLRNKVRTALSDWEGAGRKLDVEKIFAFINQVTQRDLTLWKADLLDRFEKSKIADSFGQEFWLTSLTPGGFFADESGWTTVRFTEKETDSFSKQKSTQFAIDGKIGWGKLSLGGEAGGTTDSKKAVSNVSDMSMSFSIAQIPLIQAWFDELFIKSRTWRFAPDAIDISLLSDGGDPANNVAPQGMMVAWPISIIVAKDITVNFKELHDESSELHKTFKANGSAGWGPFKLGGSYSRDQQEKRVETKLTEHGLEVQGLQIIGFRCKLATQRIPNPLPTIKEFI